MKLKLPWIMNVFCWHISFGISWFLYFFIGYNVHSKSVDFWFITKKVEIYPPLPTPTNLFNEILNLAEPEIKIHKNIQFHK